MPSEQGFHCILSTGLISCWIGTDKDERLPFSPVAMYQASYSFMLGQEYERIQLVLQESWSLQAWEKYMPKENTFHILI